MGMASAGPPPPPANCGNRAGAGSTAMGTKDRLGQKAWFLLRGSLGYSLHHTLAQHTSIAGGLKGRWSGKAQWNLYARWIVRSAE